MRDTFVGGEAAQKSWVKNPAAELPCTPDTQFALVLTVRLPMITSNFRFGSFSYKRTSTSCGVLLVKLSSACHSMLKIRLGAVPEIEVKMPHPLAQAEHPIRSISVSNSVHSGKMV